LDIINLGNSILKKTNLKPIDMKKIKFEKKLGLKKEVVAKLNNEQMSSLKGGNLSNIGAPTNSAGCSTHCY